MTKNILFITSTRIGDAILSTGVLSYLLRTYPDSRITVACGPLVESLFEGVPGGRVIPLQKETWNRHWLKLWRKTVGTKWDMVVDFRNSAVSRLVRADERFVFGPHINKNQHKVLQNAEVIRNKDATAHLQLYFTPAQIEKAKALIPEGSPVLGVGPTSNWIGKTWPVENFKQLIAELTAEGEVFSGWRVAVFGAPGEEDVANQLYDSLPSDQRINCIAKGTPGQAAAYIARCDFYIGNDSGLMHSAAAAGINTIGLFGPSNDKVYAPYGPKTTWVRTPETSQELTGAPGYDPKKETQSLMKNLKVETVKKAIQDFLKTA